MEPQDIDQYIDRLQTSFTLTARHIASELSTLDGILTGPQYYILHLLNTKEKYSVTELANDMLVKPSAITTMIDRLYKAGLVLRDRDDSDRRMVFIQLSESGREALQYAQQKRKEVFTKYLSRLTSDELKSLVSIYEKLTTIVQKNTNE